MPQTGRQRGYCFTLNNWTHEDLIQWLEFCESKFVTYCVIGFETASSGTEHLQGYMHFTEGKTSKWVHTFFPRIALINPKAEGKKFANRYLYCMKYQDKKRKDQRGLYIIDPDGAYLEYGSRPKEPATPKEATAGTSEQIVELLREGITMNELVEKFPGYMLINYNRVLEMKERLKPKEKTEFYCIKNIGGDTITEICDHQFGKDLFDTFKVAVVEELRELEAYDDYDTVIWYTEYPTKMSELYPRGVPISYKNGYQTKVVKCKRFIIVTSAVRTLVRYKTIKNY